MSQQSSKNYLRFYPAHHFVFYPIAILLLIASLYYASNDNNQLLWIFIAVVITLVIVLSFMLRQHYALLLQDRIIRLEVRYRYFATTGKRFEPFEQKLNDSQLFALRFCSDDQLEPMIQRILSENLSAAQIKQNVTSWQADEHRV